MEKSLKREIESRLDISKICPLEYAMRIIGGKWKIRIIVAIDEEKNIRYNELKRTVYGITDMVLSSSLKELVKDGVIERVQFNEIPPRVEYSLTEVGETLMPALLEITKWGKVQLEKKML
ncbi:winged helix-turn-helix transcriptional regulator [Clostridium ihumii]|uniref:winged helix-turn-helix transcriptional regulator n=1 Tax=Clostridium ihumii TaxID=1470356 RepID=UPI00058FF9B5|nr:helix-turn-helix domain-containing protein [Clostridium ihumii]